MTCLPVIMRAGGMSLKSIGLLFMLHLPWAFKFTYASFVDSRHIQGVGRRRSWIIPMQWLVVLLFGLLSQMPPESSFWAMFVLCLLAALSLATNDIAVDGYATDILKASERPWGNAIQAGSRSVGIILGGGIPLVLYETLGWQAICLLLAVALLALNLPVLFHRELQMEVHPQAARVKPSINPESMLSLLNNSQTIWLLAFLTIPTVFYFLSFQMRLPLLNDLGLSPQAMGMAMIWCGAPAGVLGSFWGGYLYQRIGPMTLMGWYVLAALAMGALSVHLSWQAIISQWSGLMVLALDNLLLGAVHVWCFTLIMKASAGPQSGARFALFSSIFLFPPLLLAPLFGMLGDGHGFAALYGVLSGLLALGFAGARILAHYRMQPFIKSED